MSAPVLRRRRSRRRSDDDGEDLPLTSMLDAVFILLIFLMIAVNFQEEVLDLRLPEVDTAATSGGEAAAIVVSVTEDGRIFVNGQGAADALDTADAGDSPPAGSPGDAGNRAEIPDVAELRRRSAAWAGRNVRLDVATAADFGRAVEILNAMRSAGVADVQIGVRRRE